MMATHRLGLCACTKNNISTGIFDSHQTKTDCAVNLLIQTSLVSYFPPTRLACEMQVSGTHCTTKQQLPRMTDATYKSTIQIFTEPHMELFLQ